MNSVGEEDKCLLSFDYKMPQGEAKSRRRRRKKAKIAGEAKTRRLSAEQVRFLEMSFGKERKLDSSQKARLATELCLEPKQVAVWFQNRRARWKSKQLEEEYLHLRSSHDAALFEKCRLENEVLKLKDKLVESEEEIKRLASAATAVTGEGGGAGSPSSSMTTAATHLGEFGMEAADEMYSGAAYGDDSSYYHYMMELSYLYGM